MEPGDIRSFLGRDWRRKEALTRRYWAERHRAEGATATLAASTALREHLRALRPEWPTFADRALDLRHHLEFVAKLDRVADAFSNR